MNELRPHIMAIKSTLEKSDEADHAKALLILHLLIDNWEGDKKLTQLQIARMIPNCGHHELWEIRMGTKMDTTVRKVRGIIEKVLRKAYKLPVLSTPGKGKMEANTAGYWLARHRTESLAYVHRRKSEIVRTYNSAQRTLKAVAQVCRVNVEF